MRVLNDYCCGDCGTITEKLVDIEFKTIECPECGGKLIYQEGCNICSNCGFTKCE